MGGENVGRHDYLERGIKIELLLDNVKANAFEPEECRVPLVHMKHIGFDPENAQRLDAANSKDDFLAHPHFQVAAIKLSGDQSVFSAIFRGVGI